MIEHRERTIMGKRKVTKADLEANNRYRKKARKQLNVSFFPSEHYLFNWIDGLDETRNAYIKRLVREDYKKHHKSED